MSVCQFEGCGRRAKVKGLCTSHTQQRYRGGPLKPLQGDIPVEDRFWSKVDSSAPGCWPWTATRNSGGYGHIRVGEKMRSAHRVSYELTHGPIPEGMQVMHSCDNPACVNPAHLSLGSNQDNLLDMARKRRQWNQGRSTCSSGHEYTEENIYRPKSRPNQIQCKECRRERVREYRARQRG